jgi:phosphoglycerol transferase MdoB-like AlkP superfamily enzyme
MDLGDFLWSLLVIYFIFFYFMILFRVIGDLFSDKEASGASKALWVVFLLFLPFLALFIYLITKGKAMNERAMARAEEMNAAQQDYIRSVAGTSDDPTAKIAKAHDLLSSGAISQAEFESLKAKALA